MMYSTSAGPVLSAIRFFPHLRFGVNNTTERKWRTGFIATLWRLQLPFHSIFMG